MARYPVTVNIKKTPLPSAAKPTPKAKPPAPVASKAATRAPLGRAERVQKMEAGESRLAKYQPPKNKPATPMVPPADRARTQATLSRAERIQREEAGESMLLKRKPVDVIRTTVRMKETPAKKK